MAIQDSIVKEEVELIGDGALPPIVLVLGGPGSGKGTQCARIAGTFGLEHLSTGDLLRREVQLGTESGNYIGDLISRGLLVPDELVLDTLCRHVRILPRSTKGVLVDGFPRTLKQAKLFRTIVGEPRLVLNYDCPSEELRQRLLQRGRGDDTPTAVERRIRQHEQETSKVIDLFRNHVSMEERSGMAKFLFSLGLLRNEVPAQTQCVVDVSATESPDTIYHITRAHFVPGSSFDRGFVAPPAWTPPTALLSPGQHSVRQTVTHALPTPRRVPLLAGRIRLALNGQPSYNVRMATVSAARNYVRHLR
ncbi:adenylate kinase-domain-containing protein [Gaertneriomyces semiglobifer]|nr:adenylate kinase-domain-containing protein [Gaertneriomyces semiglobifer]